MRAKECQQPLIISDDYDSKLYFKRTSIEEFDKLFDKKKKYLGSAEISKVETICEEMQEHLRDVCSSLQDAMSDDVMTVESFNEIMSSLEDIKKDICTQKFLIKSLHRN